MEIIFDFLNKKEIYVKSLSSWANSAENAKHMGFLARLSMYLFVTWDKEEKNWA